MPSIKGTSLKGAACVCTVAILALPGAVQAPPLPQDLPGDQEAGAPSWQTPSERDESRELYVAAQSANGYFAAQTSDVAPLADVTLVVRVADGEMVKANAIADNVHYVQGVGLKTVLEVEHPEYGTATLEVLLPDAMEVWVDVYFYGQNRATAQVHRVGPSGPNLSSVAPPGGSTSLQVCGDPDAGDCCEPNGTPACDDETCCNIVCGMDAFCCDVAWDSICATEAADFCGDLCTVVGCPLDCPGGAFDEPEACGDDTNGGCNVTPPAFTEADCGDTWCGTAWAAGGTRDTDWYRVSHGGGVISGTLVSQFPGVCFIVDGIQTCSPVVVGDIGCADQCANIALASADLPAGIYVVFVATGNCAGGGVFDGIPCGSGANDYYVSIECAPGGVCGNNIQEPGEDCDGSDDANCPGECQPDCTCPGTGNPACTPDAGDCCIANGTPGCNDPDCCNIVCGMDPFCCDVAWDGICAGEANDFCGDLCAITCDVPVDCPPGANDEGEGCGNDTNGGCNADPPAFTDALCGSTWCGTTYADLGTRDTDWYLVDHAGGPISGTVVSEMPTVCFIVDGIPACAPVVVGDIGCSANGAPIADAAADLPPGAYVVFVAPGNCDGSGIFEGFPCSEDCEDYVLSISCEQGEPCESDDDCPPGQICVDGDCIIPPPTNDFCEDATALDVPPGGSVDIAGTTIDATFDGVGFCGTDNTAPGVWYSVIGNGNTMTASTCNQADYDTKISIFCGECPTGVGSDCCFANGTPGCDDPECEAIVCGADPFCCDVAWDGICAGAANDLCEICAAGDLICVDGLDDTPGCGGFTTEISWCAKAGAEYLVLIHGFSDAVGNFTLTMSDNGSECTPTVDCPVGCETDEDCPPGFACVDGECVPVPTGACCQCDEDNVLFCTIETEADCIAAGGEYLGDDTACEAGGDDVTYTSSPGLSIPDDTAPGVFDTITVPDSFTAVDVKVVVDISHTWIGDLCVLLSKDGGTEYAIIKRMNLAGGTCDANGCCGCSSNDMNVTLWDGAAENIFDQCGEGGGLLTGTYASDSLSLTNFVGVDAAGDWTIQVSDNAGGDLGVLNSWSLVLTAPAGGGTPCEDAGFTCNEPPDCSGAFASVDELWPPNHKFHTVTVEGVVDPDGDPVTITITGIFQDEPVNVMGDGNTCPDATGVGTDTAMLRAERQGPGDGRVYHIFYTADDGQGGTCEGSVTVCVPHDQMPGNDCVDQGPLYDSTDCGGFDAVQSAPDPADGPIWGSPGQ